MDDIGIHNAQKVSFVSIICGLWVNTKRSRVSAEGTHGADDPVGRVTAATGLQLRAVAPSTLPREETASRAHWMRGRTVQRLLCPALRDRGAMSAESPPNLGLRVIKASATRDDRVTVLYLRKTPGWAIRFGKKRSGHAHSYDPGVTLEIECLLATTVSKP